MSVDTPAMTQLAKPATEWSRYAGLPAVDKTVMRLKALIGAATTKTAFFNAMRATEIRAPDGKAWSVGALNPILDRLQKKGLLGEDYACVPSLLHPITVDTIDGVEGKVLIKAVHSAFPADNRRGAYYSYSMQADDDALRRLRLAIYENNEAEYVRLLDQYNKDYNPAQGPHHLEQLFLGTSLGVDWLVQRAIRIQYIAFCIKLNGFLQSGVADPDLAPMLAHVRKHQEESEYEAFRSELLQADLLAGRLSEATAKIAGIADEHGFLRPVFQGTVDFLSGRNEAAIV